MGDKENCSAWEFFLHVDFLVLGRRKEKYYALNRLKFWSDCLNSGYLYFINEKVTEDENRFEFILFLIEDYFIRPKILPRKLNVLFKVEDVFAEKVELLGTECSIGRR